MSERGITKHEWERKHQHFETGWWADCANTYGEETKQIAYANVMDMIPGPWQAGNAWPVWDLEGKSVLDVGGGPVSMLLKAKNVARGVVVDPGDYPKWTGHRYKAHGVEVVQQPAEEYDSGGFVFDEAWLYNVLQHTMSPRTIIEMMRRSARVLRIFEWVETEPYLGHPHSLQIDQLQEWVGGEGRTVLLGEQYQEIDPEEPVDAYLDPWRVEQKAWGGRFDA